MAKANAGFCQFVNSAEAQAAIREAKSGNLDLSDVLDPAPSVEEDLEETGIMGGWRDRQTEDL